MAKQNPIPQNPIGESFVWRDWFQRLSDRVFGSAAAIDVPIQPEYGGTGITTYNVGDIIYCNSTDNLTRLAAPASTSVLQMTALGVPSWTTAGAGTVTSVGVSGGTTGLTTSGGPITSSGTITFAGTLAVANGGTGLTTYATGDTLYASASNTLSKFAKPSSTAIYTMTSAGAPTWKVPKYGAFHDTTNQTAAANTPTAITYNQTDISSGVSLGSPTSRVVIDTAGLYNLQFSIQFANTTASIDDVVVWFKVNGTNVSNSASWVSVTAKHSGVNGTGLMALNFFYEFAANDYFELWWMSLGGNASLSTIPLSASPSYPESPSVILTVFDNIKA